MCYQVYEVEAAAEERKMRFYVTAAWKQLRLERLAKDNYLCQRCLKRKRIVPATTVHHIKPVKDYPELALVMDNLISLCNTCHGQVEDRYRKWRERREDNKRQRRARVIVSQANEARY